jgi:DNA repair protein RadA/Sms
VEPELEPELEPEPQTPCHRVNRRCTIPNVKPPKTVFVCQECGGQQPKWVGRCPDCGAWNSLVEEQPAPQAAPAAASHRYGMVSGGASAKLYSDIQTSDAPRIPSGIDEFDRVLGGGIVPGALVLLGGEPGIGKSTLLLQVAAHVARSVGPVLYSSGEESEHQIKLRGERLSVDRSPLYLLAETCLERILEEIERLKPALVIVDSIQTIFSARFQSAPGSIGQVREVATHLLFAAKGRSVPIVLVGHVTKDGNLAGPKALEHVVDTVLYFRRETASRASRRARLQEPVRAASELGVFEMTATGLREVPTRRSYSLPSARSASQVQPCCAASKGRGRYLWKCRRSSPAARSAMPGGWPAASISSACRCCWRSWRSAPAFICSATTYM